MLFNKERIHEWTTDQLFASATLGTYQTCGICIPFFHNWRQTFTTVTCHPKAFEHILRTRFNNYPKGPTWKNTFHDHVRGSQGTVDFTKENSGSRLSKLKLIPTLYNWVNPTIKNGLLPILDKATKQSISVDLEDLKIRFGTDNIFGLALGKKLKTLNTQVTPEDELVALAIDTTIKSFFKRLFYPNFVLNFMRFFSIGSEQSLKKSLQVLNNYITESLEERNNRNDETFDDYDFLWTLMKKVKVNGPGHILSSSDIMISTIVDILLGDHNSVATSASWFFWLVMNNSHVGKKIVDEISTILKKNGGKDGDGSKITNSIESPCGEETQEWIEEPLSYEEINSFVYLHVTLLETLRLYPSFPRIVRYVTSDDILPGGTFLDDICVCGEDFLEFKPERCLSDDETKIERREDGYMIAAFNGGSRTCIGKYLSFLEMKSAASAILLRYKLCPVLGHQVVPKPFFTLSMKNGLKVNLKRRDLAAIL
ncbi:hypothetical protein H5410_032802 [Solanum commersonii]|uniref:Cytochrome P450 n=1 Tax=Solanum commersonii TaxID=4109 RepID=A0A9J5YNY5_SOLCO|nr:hypothetical protein H5410_032802 [Solanum commersonii]